MDSSELDVLIIGGGVVGCATLQAVTSLLSQRQNTPQPKVLMVEAGSSLLAGSSRGNSAMIHSGFDTTPGSTESRMVKRGHQLFEDFAAKCKENRVHLPWKPLGALMVIRDQSQLETVQQTVIPKAEANGVPVRLVTDPREIAALEPHLASGVLALLSVPSEWAVDPWMYPVLQVARAKAQGGSGVVVKTATKALAIRAASTGRREVDLLNARTKKVTKVITRCVINCAGLFSAHLEKMRGIANPPFELFPRLGRFIAFESSAGAFVSHALIPIPTKKTKGIIVFPSVYGHVVVGPTAEDPDEPRVSQSDVEVKLRAEAEQRVPALKSTKKWYIFAGKRPALKGKQDYHLAADICPAAGAWVTVAGVRSTGLTSSVALAEWVSEQIAPFFGLTAAHVSSNSTTQADGQWSAAAVTAMQQAIADDGARIGGTTTHPLSSMGRSKL